MKLFKHITGQPFVFATGLAALVHSTWSLGTLFAGNEPAPQLSLAWFAWLIPALLIAFALDVGQIVTSAEIRAGQRKRAKYLTFLVFAAATYYLQWLYIAHHMPQVDLAAGVRPSWSDAASLIRDAALWFIPALLPLSTALYTFSHMDVVTDNRGHDNVTPGVTKHAESTRHMTGHSAEPLPAIAQPNVKTLPESIPEPLPGEDDTPLGLPVILPLEAADSANDLVKPYSFRCSDCGYSNTYTTDAGRAQGKRAHNRHCAEKVRA